MLDITRGGQEDDPPRLRRLPELRHDVSRRGRFEFRPVALCEFRKASWVMSIPSAQVGAWGGVLHPFVVIDCFFRLATRPQSIDKHSIVAWLAPRVVVDADNCDITPYHLPAPPIGPNGANRPSGIDGGQPLDDRSRELLVITEPGNRAPWPPLLPSMLGSTAGPTRCAHRRRTVPPPPGRSPPGPCREGSPKPGNRAS